MDMMLEIMDTTLRDGEQTPSVAFSPPEKLLIAQKLLLDVNVNRIEVASCGVSETERQSLTNIMDWAKKKGLENRVEVLGFVDHEKSINWLSYCGCRCLNLLVKGSEKHCRVQLNKSLVEHIHDIDTTLSYAIENNISVSAYLEDWSNGMGSSPEYVMELITALQKKEIKRIYLADTLGIMNPIQLQKYLKLVIERFPEIHFEFHGHNDYGLAVSNSLTAVQSGVKGVHTSVNGLGERAGNCSLAEVSVCIEDFTNLKVQIVEKHLKDISRLVETYSGKILSENTPIVGKNVFTQTAGIHADGDKKGGLYSTQLKPKRFNRKVDYALGKLSGKSSIELRLRDLGIDLDRNQIKLLLSKVVTLGEQKKSITNKEFGKLIEDIF
jgi:(R)-citramalate synthase